MNKKAIHICMIFLCLIHISCTEAQDKRQSGIQKAEANNVNKAETYTNHIKYVKDVYDSIDKNDIVSAIANDTILYKSARHIEVYGCNEDKALAMYLLGIYYDCKGHSIEALECLNNAYKYSQTSPQWGNHALLAKINKKISCIYNDMDMPYEEIEYLEKAKGCYREASDTIGIHDIEELLLEKYLCINMRDSIKSKSNIVFGKHDDDSHACKRMTGLIYSLSHFMEKNDSNTVDDLMSYIEKELIENSMPGIFCAERNYCEALYLEHNSLLDSAEAKYEQVFHYKEAPIKLKVLAWNKIKRLNKKEDIISTSEYVGILDSIIIDMQKCIESRAKKKYEYGRYLSYKRKQNITKTFVLVGSLIIVFIIILMAICVYYRQKQKQCKDELFATRKKLMSLSMEYGKAKKQILDIQNNFEIYKERQIEQMNEMRIMLSSYAENSLSIERWEKESEIYNNAIIEKIHENIRKGILPQNAEIKKITCLIEQSLPVFWAFINDEDKKLSQQEIVVCCLIRLCFELSEIATILNISIQRVTNIKSSINQKLFGVKKAKGLETSILSI